MFRILIAFILLTPGLLFAEGGETIETATIIPVLPYEDVGHTCDNVNDYDEICPYSGSTAPDVVYSYTPEVDVVVNCALCNSSYDTKVYIYADSVGNLAACNDDGCLDEWQSRILDFPMEAGVTYYFVIDGYGSACGEYIFEIGLAPAPCVVDCPPGSLHEGEPPCQDGYVDVYNSGCDGSGWTPIEAQAGSCADLCGKLCGYVLNGTDTRDVDWYRLTAVGGSVTATVEAEFFAELSLVYVPDCALMEADSVTAFPCYEQTIERTLAPGQEFWLIVAPYANYWHMPEREYHLHICGIQGGATPVVPSTWGKIKSSYR